MADETENIVLENLRRMRTQLDKIESILEQHTEQFAEVRRGIFHRAARSSGRRGKHYGSKQPF
ncbi:MAG: hypothetical protein PF501_00100 [Salinisphaera sp.]|jgi:hypothetical protein|nr:hypothetical protein [Salinisphaera sp.]